MRVVLQRVRSASVGVAGRITGSIQQGYVLLVGIAASDVTSPEITIEGLVRKILSLKLIDNSDGRMDRTIVESNGELLVVSQFTLLASTEKGSRPSWHRAAKPEIARPIYEQFVTHLASQLGRPVATGEFGAEMQVMMINDGPVTLILDSVRE